LKSIDIVLKANNFIYFKNNFTELVLFAHNLKHIVVLKLTFATNAPFFLIEVETCVKQQHQRHSYSGAVRVTMKAFTNVMRAYMLATGFTKTRSQRFLGCIVCTRQTT